MCLQFEVLLRACPGDLEAFWGHRATLRVRGANPQHFRYSKAGFSSTEAAAVKKYDTNFIFLEPRPEYIIDNINNGLYR